MNGTNESRSALLGLIDAAEIGADTVYERATLARSQETESGPEAASAMALRLAIDLRSRSAERAQARECRRQDCIDAVVAGAVRHLPDTVSIKSVDPDWSVQFFNRAQDVQDVCLRDVWSRVLAAEVSNPGTFSKQTLRRLETLTSSDLDALATFCRFALECPSVGRLILDTRYVKNGIAEAFGDGASLEHLVDHGLVRDRGMMGHSVKSIGKWRIEYFGTKLLIEAADPQDPLDFFTFTLLTEAGNELSEVMDRSPIEGFVDGLIRSFAEDEHLQAFRIEV